MWVLVEQQLHFECNCLWHEAAVEEEEKEEDFVRVIKYMWERRMVEWEN